MAAPNSALSSHANDDWPRDGFEIVLAADRSLMAAYPLLVDGMSAASLTTVPSSLLMHNFVAPPVAMRGPRAVQAPLGLRRVEAALRRDGFTAAQLTVVPAEGIERAIGPRTRVVGLSTGDPLGIGMNSTTMSAIFGGRPITSALFQKLLAKVRRRISQSGAAARIMVGGPGAWQLSDSPDSCRRLGIDHVMAGYCEANVAEVVRDLAAGRELPLVIAGRSQGPAEIPHVAGATVMGMIEVTRGCGWGCRFCTLGHEPMLSLPIETIRADIETNLRDGVRNISLTSEDFFRYGSPVGRRAAPEAVLGLLEELRAMPGLRSLAIDHANVSTVAAISDQDLATMRRLIAETGTSAVGATATAGAGRRIWVNLGIESAAGELVAANGGAVKLRPAGAAEWDKFCLEQVRRLCWAGFLPMISLVLGLPGERPEHIEQTVRWVDQLRDEPVSVVPVFHTPVSGESDAGSAGNSGATSAAEVRRFGAADVGRRQWDLFLISLRLTFKWLPRVYWHDHAQAGVPLWRRVAVQVMGQGYAIKWKSLIRLRRLMAGP